MEKLIFLTFVGFATITLSAATVPAQDECPSPAPLPTEPDNYTKMLTYGPGNPQRITEGGQVTLQVTGGTSPYYWTLSDSTNYSLGSSTTNATDPFNPVSTNTVTSQPGGNGAPVTVTIVDSSVDSTGNSPPNQIATGTLQMDYYWDYTNSDEVIYSDPAAGNTTANLKVVGGCGTYTWSVSDPVNYQLAAAETTTTINTLEFIGSGSACGAVDITVTSCYETVSGNVKGMDSGTWGYPIAYDGDAIGVVSQGGGTNIGNGWWRKDEGKYRYEEQIWSSSGTNYEECTTTTGYNHYGMPTASWQTTALNVAPKNCYAHWLDFCPESKDFCGAWGTTCCEGSYFQGYAVIKMYYIGDAKLYEWKCQ